MGHIGGSAIAIVLTAAATLVSADAVFAQTYPSKSIRFISPQPPAGTFDYVTRIAKYAKIVKDARIPPQQEVQE